MEKLEWTAPEYEQKEKSTDWFWALGVIVVCGSIAAIIYGNYFFAVLLVLSGLSFVMFSVKKPELIHYELNKDGLRIKSQLYLYRDIKAFFVRTEGTPVLFIKSSRAFMPMLSMPIAGIPPQTIKNILLANNIPEEEMKEHFSEKIVESLGL